MIDFYHNQGTGKTRISALGSATELVADVALCCATLYARTKAASPDAAEVLKSALMIVFSEESPIWTEPVPQGSEADSFTVVKIDLSEIERQAREDQDADA